MPYSITTKDGIAINNIPDDIAPDAQVLKDRVAQERAKLNGVDQESAPQQSTPEISEQDSGFIGSAARFGEPALTVASSIVAEPIAGIAGIGQALNPFAEQGAGAKAVKATREALTFKPRTQEGKEGLKSVGEALAPVGDAISSIEKGLGDSVFDATGSPALAAAAATAPTAIMEAIGFGIGRKAAKASKSVGASAAQAKELLKEAAPSAEDLKNISRSVYKELDNSGIRMKPKVFEGMVNKVEKAAKSQGLSPRTTKKAAGAIADMRDLVGKSPTLSEVDDLRKVAQGVAGSLDGTEKALGARMIAEIDNFMDGISPKALQMSDGVAIKASEIAPKYKAARNLWGRARKSELIQESIEAAKTRASGFENGMRIELGKLAKNKGTRKFLSKDEISMIRSIEAGNTSQNVAKFLGRFAISEGRSSNVLSALGGIAGGSVVGGAIGSSTFGALAVPVVGQIARGVAKNLTKGRVDFLDAITRAGKSGEDIAKAYISSVPKANRSVPDLAKLLSDPTIDLAPLFNSASKNIKDAAEIAAGRQLIGGAAGLAVPLAIQQRETQ
jgi:outer membrane lipoprotein SlyB